MLQRLKARQQRELLTGRQTDNTTGRPAIVSPDKRNYRLALAQKARSKAMHSLPERLPSLFDFGAPTIGPNGVDRSTPAIHKLRDFVSDSPPPNSPPPSNADKHLSFLTSRVIVKIYVRHTVHCPNREDRFWRNCGCPKWLYINFNGRDRRVSAKTRSWKRAEEIRQQYEDSFDPNFNKRQEKRIAIHDAIQRYLDDVAARNLAPETLRRCRLILTKQLLPWCERNAIRYLDDLTAAQLTTWRSVAWRTVAPITSQTRQQRLVNFFEFCIRQDWLLQNPARRLTPVKVKLRPTAYFTRPEFERLVEATYVAGRRTRSKDPNFDRRLRSLLLLMRWSGLRLGDAVRLECSQLVGDRVILYQAKTGTPVSVLLPAETAEYLRQIPTEYGEASQYFFCKSLGDAKTAVGRWSRSFRHVFKIADIRKEDGTPKRCHIHMLRDTFSVESLLAGVPLDQVSALLGHSKIETTRKHYTPWVVARQQQLDTSIKSAHSVEGITKSCDEEREARRGTMKLPFNAHGSSGHEST